MNELEVYDEIVRGLRGGGGGEEGGEIVRACKKMKVYVGCVEK